MKEIGKDTAFYEQSGGGITLSGGEPLWQMDFTSAILKECKKQSIHTAVDTCGYASSRAVERIKDEAFQKNLCEVVEARGFQLGGTWFNPRMKVTPVKLPPRRSKTDIACRWEFVLEE
jgi:hypothetical protein